MDRSNIQEADRAVLSIIKQNANKLAEAEGKFKATSAKEALSGKPALKETSGIGEKETAMGNNEEDISIVVHYNPKSIQYSASATDQQQDAAEGTGVPKSITAVCSITMSMELLFYRKDAEDDSVRKQIEILLGLMCKSKNRQVRFSWANMIIEGVVTSFSSSFDLFDCKGEPVSAKVQISIQSKEEIEDKSYDKLMQLS